MLRERMQIRQAEVDPRDDPMEIARRVTESARLRQVFKDTVDLCGEVCDDCSVLKPCVRWHLAAQRKAETGIFTSSDAVEAIKAFKRIKGNKGIAMVVLCILPCWRIGLPWVGIVFHA